MLNDLPHSVKPHLVLSVVQGEVLCQVEEHLPAEGLVAVHVGHQLEHGLPAAALRHVLAQLGVHQISRANRFSERPHSDEVREPRLQSLEPLDHLLVRLVAAHVDAPVVVGAVGAPSRLFRAARQPT